MKKVVDPINYYIWYHISYVVCYKVGSHKRLLNGCQVISWSFLNQDVAQGTQKPTPQKGQTKCRGSVKLRHDIINNQPKRKKRVFSKSYSPNIFTQKKKNSVCCLWNTWLIPVYSQRDHHWWKASEFKSSKHAAAWDKSWGARSVQC